MKRIKKSYVFAALLAIVLLGGGTAVATRYQRDMDATRARIAGLGSQVISTECGEIEYAQYGSGDPVLVVHGNGGGVDQGLGLAQGYIDAGYQVIAPSRFGYLRTPLPDGATVEMQADAYACLLDALGVKQVAVFSTSAGVTSSIQFAIRHPQRVSALVLHSPNPLGEVGLVPPPQPAFRAMLSSEFTWWALTTYMNKSAQVFVGVPEGFNLSPQFQSEVDAALKSVQPVRQRVDGMVFDTYTGNPAINTFPLDQVQVPTLVISAVDDPMALHKGARALAEGIPGARLIAVPDGGHMMLGHTAEVRAQVTGFLQEAAATAK